LQETWTYGYDQRNQLVWVEKRATDGGTLQLKDEFKYDAFGNRIEKRIDADGNGTWDTTQRYALDGWKNLYAPSPLTGEGRGEGFVGNENWDVWADLDGSSSLTTRYIRGDVVDQLFARITSGGTAYWYLTDHLGSLRDVIDSSAVDVKLKSKSRCSTTAHDITTQRRGVGSVRIRWDLMLAIAIFIATCIMNHCKRSMLRGWYLREATWQLST
jgi:acyl-CoA-binding protein